MSTEPKKPIEKSEKALQKETTGYCLQMGSEYCKNECPNNCNDRFQNLVDKLFEDMKGNKIGNKQ